MGDRKYETVGIICAMAKEVTLLEKTMTESSRETVSGVEYISGTMEGVRVVLAVCGVGKVFAAICAQTMILKYHPDVILNAGVAGSLTEGLHIGDIAIADKVVQHDMDTSPVGDPFGLISGINKVYLPATESVAALLKECVEECAGEQGIHAMIGTIASGDQFVHTKEQRETIVKRFKPIACEMEGAAIGQVAYVNGIDYGILRAISDEGNEAAKLDYPVFVRKAAKTAAEITTGFLRKIR